VYVTRCQVTEVLPRTHTNCTNEILVILNGTNMFVDPISFMIKAAAAPVRGNDIAPPRWRLNGRWYYAFPEIRDCAEPGRIPMKPIAIDDIKVMNLGLGRSSRASRRARECGVHSWPRVRRWPTTVMPEDSGAQVFEIWPRRAS
jgi:hypothetical protein